MTRLDVWDRQPKRPHIFLELRDFIPLLPKRARQSLWQITAFEWPDAYPHFEVVGCEHMYQLEESRDRIGFPQLAGMAVEVGQVIWGSFKAFDNDWELPWLVLSAVDSTFWRVATEDESLLAAVRHGFEDVRATVP